MAREDSDSCRALACLLCTLTPTPSLASEVVATQFLSIVTPDEEDVSSTAMCSLLASLAQHCREATLGALSVVGSSQLLQLRSLPSTKQFRSLHGGRNAALLVRGLLRLAAGQHQEQEQENTNQCIADLLADEDASDAKLQELQPILVELCGREGGVCLFLFVAVVACIPKEKKSAVRRAVASTHLPAGTHPRLHPGERDLCQDSRQTVDDVHLPPTKEQREGQKVSWCG